MDPSRRPLRDDPVSDVRAELDAHFAGTVSLLVSRGWTEEAARAEVRRRFGDEGRYRRQLEDDALRRVRRRRAIRAFRGAATAVRAGVRDVVRSPALSSAVVATLALGLGANAAMFRVVDRLLLSPPPHIEAASEVRRLHRTIRLDGSDPRTIDAFTYAEVGAMRAAAPDVPLGVIMSYIPETVGGGEDAVRLRVGRVDEAYFPLLGVRAVLGRGLLPEDHGAGAAVAVLSHDAWRSHFGGDTAVLGRRIRAARGEYEVVGILPEGFRGSHPPAADIWIPLETEAPAWWGPGWRDAANILAFGTLARLPRHVDEAAWTSRMLDALRAANDDGATEVLAVTTSSLVPGSAPNPRATVAVSRWLAGVSLLVLLVACANVANLFLAHGERRRHETAVRMALGAGAGTLRAELLVRSLLLAVLGAAGAALFALWAGGILQRLFLEDLALPARPATDRLIVFTAGLGVAAALLAGLLPALRAPRLDVNGTLQGGARVAAGAGVARRLLASLQVALCTLLLVGAGLFVTSLRNALHVDLGFDHDRLIMLRLERDAGVDASRSRLLRDAGERLAALPYVVASSGTVAVPFTLLYGLPAALPGGDRIEDLHVNAVGPTYFRTMGVPLLRGRGFDERDGTEGAEPVVIVSRRAAERLWPGRDPLGECLLVGREPVTCSRIVGIAADHAGAAFGPGDLAPETAMHAWVPLGHPGAQPASSLLVRTAGPPARVLAQVRRAAAVPGVRYVEAELMSHMVGREFRAWRLGATVFSLFGLVALLVAAVGLHGILGFEVAQRRREFGIRAALGAGPIRVLAPLLRFAAPVIAAGLLAGAIAATLAAGRLAPLLYDLTPRQPSVFAAAAAAVLAAAFAALLAPAWRVARADPREALNPLE